jgi:hypothetical protein
VDDGRRARSRSHSRWHGEIHLFTGLLLRESAFRAFNTRLHKTPSIAWVFIIADSRESFVEMNEQLPAHIPLRQRIHLYRNYIDNFQISRGGDGA